jgi:DNA-binding CsgD family transcriptional regulator
MTAVELGSAAPTGLLERENELATVRAWLGDVRAERGRMLLVEAPAGLGKSALIDHVREIARGEFILLRASGSEVEQELGWGVARSLFEPWLRRLPDHERADVLSGPAASAKLLLAPGGEATGLPASEASFAILHGLYWLATHAAETRPTLLIVDDAHWADEPSLRLLAFVLGRIRDQPIGLLVAARTGEPGAGGLLGHLAAEAGVTVCEPAPLSAAAVTALIRERLPEADADFCARCHELTAGNPLGVREVLLAITECPPAAAERDLETIAERAARSLSRSVLRRLAALPGEARALADAMSVFEVDAELAWVAALAELEPAAALAAVDQLERADILTGEDQLRFRHPLLCATIYASLPRARKARLHRQAAGLLQAAHLGPECVAPHLLASPPAGDVEIVEALRDAARCAMAHGVPASAAHYLERALREPPHDRDRADVLTELGRAEASFAPDLATQHLEAAIGLTGEPELRAAIAVELGRALHDAGRPEDACATFERGLAELQDDSSELATELEAWYLTAALLVPARVHDAHRRADEVATRPGIAATPAGRLLVSRSVTVLVRAGRSHEQLIALARMIYGDDLEPERSRASSRARGPVVDELPIEIAVAGALGYSDQYERAGAILAHALREARRVGWMTWFAAGSLLQARFRLWTGPIGDVIGEGMTGLEVFTDTLQIYLPVAAHSLACALIESDEYDKADELLARAERGSPAAGPLAAWQCEARGRLAAATGDWTRAHQEFLACGESAELMQLLNPAMFGWRSQAGIAALRLGREEQARELVEEELARAKRFGAPRALGVAQRAAALLETGPTVEDVLTSSAGLLSGCGARVELAYTLVELGGAIRRSGRPTTARDTLREAIAIAEEIGARRAARLAREELQRAGGRAASARSSDDDLTPSERRVAELAAQGRTNREIANELFVTVKAVEWHLGNSYRKLDIRGRGALAEALSTRD